MANRIVVDPVTRIEGHLRIEVEVKDGKVVDAYSSGTMVRGFEIILKGRDPRDAWAFTERACGVCTTVHALGSVRAVEDATRIRANRATGWPVTAWFSRFKPDPLKRLHLDLGRAGRELTGSARTSVPKATGIQRARVDTEVRALADQVTDGMTTPWSNAIRSASVSRLPDLTDGLDRAVATTDLGAAKMPAWAGLVRVLQWLLILTAIGGALWLGALFGFAYLRLPEPPTPEIGGIAWPTVMLVGGIVLGVLLALVCRLLVGLTARRRARAADRRLRDAISGVSRELVVEPVEAELTAYSRVREGLATALR